MTKAEVATAQQRAIDQLDRAKSDIIERIDELKTMLEATSVLLSTRGAGNRAAAIESLSLACDAEYDLLGDTCASSGYAQALGIEEDLSEYEEQRLNL